MDELEPAAMILIAASIILMFLPPSIDPAIRIKEHQLRNKKDRTRHDV